jgi:hypothetical protein
MTATQEADVLLQEIYRYHRGTKKEPRITDYFETMKKHHPTIFDAKITLIRHSIVSIPFATWVKSKPAKKTDSPKWWIANNNVKHKRKTLFSEANLENVIDAVSALLLLNMHYDILQKGHFSPEPKTQLFGFKKVNVTKTGIL